MAIAFYCEDEDPKMLYNGSSQAYYAAAYGYQQQQQQQQSQQAIAVGPQQHHQAGSDVSTAGDENNNNNNNNNNCALHGGGASGESGSDEGQHEAVTVHSSNRQLMRVLHQVLYRYTMEGVLGPEQTSCMFCNRIYYLFQLLY